MTSRQIRRAQERRDRKLARKGVANAIALPQIEPVEAVAAAQPTPEIAASPAESPRTRAEINRENAQHSSGPRSKEGKARSSMNHFKHGFCGAFSLLPAESKQDFDDLLAALRQDHQPANTTEDILVERMAQHHWLRQRAIHLQTTLLSDDGLIEQNEKSFSLYLRYQTANERAFSKCLHDLLKLRAAQRQAEQDVRKAENHARKAETELRKQEQREAEDKRKLNPSDFDKLVADLEAEHLRDMAIVERMLNEPISNRFLHHSDPAVDRVASNGNR